MSSSFSRGLSRLPRSSSTPHLRPQSSERRQAIDLERPAPGELTRPGLELARPAADPGRQGLDLARPKIDGMPGPLRHAAIAAASSVRVRRAVSKDGGHSAVVHENHVAVADRHLMYPNLIGCVSVTGLSPAGKLHGVHLPMMSEDAEIGALLQSANFEGCSRFVVVGPISVFKQTLPGSAYDTRRKLARALDEIESTAKTSFYDTSSHEAGVHAHVEWHGEDLQVFVSDPRLPRNGDRNLMPPIDPLRIAIDASEFEERRPTPLLLC